MLQLEETKQIKLNLNNSNYNKLNILETKIKYLLMWSWIEYQPTRTCPISECGSLRIAPLSRRPIHRLLLHFKQFSCDHTIFNTEIE